MLALRELRVFVTALPIRRLGSPKGGDGLEAVHNISVPLPSDTSFEKDDPSTASVGDDEAHGVQVREVATITPRPMVGIAYRAPLDAWTRANLDQFDVLEITVDDCIFGSRRRQSAIFDLVGRVPLTAHGVGLSIGTDVPIDLRYLDKVAEVIERLGAPAYSEHLAFTGVPGRELGNLLPLPRTEAIAESVIAKVRIVQARVGVPFLLENITYFFEWPDSDMSDTEFTKLICRETGAGLLLDVENLYLNAANHGLDAYEFVDALPMGVVREVHVAGGTTLIETSGERPFVADTHSHPVPDAGLDLLGYVLRRHRPAAIVLERDERLDAVDEILVDMARIRSRVPALQSECPDADMSVGSTG